MIPDSSNAGKSSFIKIDESPDTLMEKFNKYVVLIDKSGKKSPTTTNKIARSDVFSQKTEPVKKEASDFKKLKELLQYKNNKSMNLDNSKLGESKLFKSYENMEDFKKKQDYLKTVKSFKGEDKGVTKVSKKRVRGDRSFTRNLDRSKMKSCDNSKEKIGKLLEEKFSGLNEYQKLLEMSSNQKTSQKRPLSTLKKNSDKDLRENVVKEGFYYISKLAKSLEIGKEVLKKSAQNGSTFEYEYQLVTPEGSKSELSFEEDPKKNPYFNHFHHCLQSIAFVSTLDQLPDDEFLEKKVYLPPKKDRTKKTLILDLDETLVHCSEDLTKPCDFKTPIKFTGGEVINFGVTIRPKAIEFLELMSEYFEIVIFTASHACYANIILNILDPENQFITYRMFRDSCIETEERIFIKDLRIFGNRDFDDMVIVDNACYSYSFQLDNGVPIIPYFCGKSDTELIELAAFLTSFGMNTHKFDKIVKDRKEEGHLSSFKFGDRLIDNDFHGFLEDVSSRIGKYEECFDHDMAKSFKKRVSGYFKCAEYKRSLERFGEGCSIKLAKVLHDYVQEIEN